MNLQDLLDGAIDIILAWRFAVVYLDWECSTRNGECSSIAEEAGELVVSEASYWQTHFLCIHGGRGDDKFQVSPPCQDCQVSCQIMS